MGSKLLRQLRPLTGYGAVPRCGCHAVPSSAAEAQMVISAMREDALSRIGLDVKMKRLEVCSYLDRPGDQDDDVQLAGGGAEAVLAECARHLASAPPPLARQYREVQSPFLFGETVRVLQWNVLAQALATNNDNFVRLGPASAALDWKHHRRWRMIEEVLRHAPDLVCLQEVDHPRLLSRALAAAGYSGRHLHKPDSPCLYLPHNNGPDGCALFYNAAKFELISWATRVLRVWDVPSNQVILGAILRSRETGQELVVATTHLKAKFGELRASFRLEQSKDILGWLEAIRGGRPVILTGDLNGEPSEEFYSALTRSRDLALEPSYGPDTEYTTWKVRDTGEQKHVLDYILHTPGQLETLRTLAVPGEAALGEDRLPSAQFCSDHISLVADISLISYVN